MAKPCSHIQPVEEHIQALIATLKLLNPNFRVQLVPEGNRAAPCYAAGPDGLFHEIAEDGQLSAKGYAIAELKGSIPAKTDLGDLFHPQEPSAGTAQLLVVPMMSGAAPKRLAARPNSQPQSVMFYSRGKAIDNADNFRLPLVMTHPLYNRAVTH